MIFVLFDCCNSLLLPSIVRGFLATFAKGERGGVFYIPLLSSSLKIVDSVYAAQHCVALVLGATQTKRKSVESRKNSCTNTEGLYYFLIL